MSDCSTNANRPYDVARLRIEFQDGEVPWMYPLALNGRVIRGVYVDNERYELGSDALRLACQHVAEDTGSCPYDVHHLECASWEDDCDGRCSANVDMAACWQRYFNAKAVSA